ncbi:MAG: putative sulfate exporter family transporter [Thermoflexales bacterium]|nr:putative sulfate exporter family transporter [Thermoflexales bacterium]
MSWFRKHLPGILLAAAIGLVAFGLQLLEIQFLRQAIIEGLVIAILLGMLFRTVRGMPASAAAGVSFTAKQVLEFAVLLLGASVNFADLMKAGPILLIMIVSLVIVVLLISTRIGRAFGLSNNLATLVAVGNSICGNSAIASVAPVIGASKEEIASSISLTAVLGVLVVLTLPVFHAVLGYTERQYGVLAGMSVYAVPQVVAAGYSVSALAGDTATLVKLVRVLMIGPVVLTFSLLRARAEGGKREKFTLTRFVPWFIIGFVILSVLRSTGLLPGNVADAIREVSRWLTIAAMAALGLGVDFRQVRKVGRPVALAVVASLAVMIALSAILIKLLGIGL